MLQPSTKTVKLHQLPEQGTNKEQASVQEVISAPSYITKS